ncbi:MAG: redoxin domain-containing protein [bacterium]|nr:redoxin domain-containing protein [bacterium]
MGKINEIGASLFAISPQLSEHNRALIEKHQLGFEILYDSGNETAAAYGLRWPLPDNLKALYSQFGIDLPTGNEDDSWTLPLPARYIVDCHGTIVYARTDPDYTRRPEPDETVTALAKLA